MSSTATINMSGSMNQIGQTGVPQTSATVFHVGGSSGQNTQRGHVFHVAGNKPGQATFMEEPAPQFVAPGPKLAFSASNYPANAQQQQYQQQYQMEAQYQPQQQYQIQQQYQPQQQQFQPQYQPYQQEQPMYEQAQYQPYEQYQQQYPQPQQVQYQPIQMVNAQPQMSIQTKDFTKPPVFEAPVGRIQIVRKNQSVPFKSPTPIMQQSFRSSRSGSLAALDDITDPPHFVKHPEPNQMTAEGDPASLSARVIPAGDPNLTVQWYKDGQPLAAGSRFNTSFERGFAILEILYTFKEDSGEYSCVAKNNFGMDQTTPSILNVAMDESVVMNSHLPQEMADNIAAMEENLSAQRISNEHFERPVQPPKFIRPIPGLFNLQEGQNVHLETVFVPINDSGLIIEWFKNGKPLNNGSRFNIIADRGFAILDIIGLVPEDCGDYFCLARNSVGQAQSNVVRLIVTAEASVVTTSQLPKESVQLLQALDSYQHDDVQRPDFRYEETEEIESPPHFDIKPVDSVVEDGGPAKFLVKVSGYPRPRIQWFLNDSPAISTSTQRVYSDGSISYFEFNKCKHIGDSHILVIAQNELGEATANATLTVIPINDFRPELKRVDPENPFRKLTTLKKVDVSPELRNAFKKQKPLAIELNTMELESAVRGRQNRSYESANAENLYTNVQAKLRRSDKLSYAGAPNTNVPRGRNTSNDYALAEYSSSSPVPLSQPVLQSTQMAFNISNPTYGIDHGQSEFTIQLGN